ncbi:MAG: M48 family metalloprotease [Gemmatimonadetes bacterium]|nr:M48 family metalloprotease [Gemmatimonadota bacterium]
MRGDASAILLPLVRREQRHRRLVLLALALLLVLSISPVVGHHLIGAVRWLPASQQHLGIICLVALHHLLAPVHEATHVLLYAGVIYAVINRSRAAWRQSVITRVLAVELPPADAPLSVAAARVGLDPARLRVVGGLPNPAFTTGWWRPRVFVARDLPSRLSLDELEAVLAHEAEHVRRRDPLRLFLLRTLAAVLFWLPAIRRLVDDLGDEVEITADDAAARSHALPLAAAILKMAGADLGVPDVSVGFQRADLFERRIRRLAGEDAMVGTHVSRRSIAAAAAALLAVWVSGVIVLHPLPAPGDPVSAATHCEHPGAWAISHLFCRGLHPTGSSEHCPHERAAPSIPSA